MNNKEKISIFQVSPLHLYGQFTPLKYAIGIMLPLFLAVIFDVANVKREANIIKNMAVLYSLNTEMWNHFELLKSGIVSMAAHGTKYQFKKMHIVEAVSEEIRKLKETTEGLSKLQAEDLGDYQDHYAQLFAEDFDLCADIISRDWYNVTRCGQGAGSYFKNNIELVLKYVISVSNEAVDTMQQIISAGERDDKLRLIWTNSKIKAFLVTTSRDGVNTNIYYLVFQSLVIHFQQYLKTSELKAAAKDSKSLQLVLDLLPASRIFFGFGIFFVLVSLPALYYLVVNKFVAAFEVFNSTHMLLPWTLMMNNPLLSHHFND